MQKEKKVRTYTRKTKSGKTVQVKGYTQKYDAAEEARKAFAQKAGAGDELTKIKQAKPAPANDALGFSADDFKAWYHWDMEADPKNASAMKVKKALIAKMGRSAYNKYEQQMTDSYSARGHLKAFKGLGDLKSQEQASKEKLQMKHVKEKRAHEERADREKYGRTVVHANGDSSNKWGVKKVSPVVEDASFTKKLEGDAYSEVFPKGGSYKFFYGEDKRGRKQLYAQQGKRIIPVEDMEPSRSLAKALGGGKVTNKESASTKMAAAHEERGTKTDSSGYISKDKFMAMSDKQQDNYFDKVVRNKEYTTRDGTPLGPRARIKAMQEEAKKFRKFYGISSDGTLKKEDKK